MSVLIFKATWALKMRALTEQLSIDDIEGEEEGIVDSYFNSDAIAENAKVGTSLKTAENTCNQRSVLILLNNMT